MRIEHGAPKHVCALPDRMLDSINVLLFNDQLQISDITRIIYPMP